MILKTGIDIREKDIGSYWSLVIRHRRVIYYTISFFVILSFIQFIFTKPAYKAHATIVPTTTFNIVLGENPSANNLLFNTGMTILYYHAALLRSRRLAERVIQKYDLMAVYHIKNNDDDAINRYNKNLGISIDDNGLIHITYIDNNPNRAAEIVNELIASFNDFVSSLITTKAGATREFMEKQLKRNFTNLSELEDSMRAYQERTGIYALPSQIEEAIIATAAIESQLITVEINKYITQEYSSPGNPLVQNWSVNASQLNKILSQPLADESDSTAYHLLSKNLPRLAVNYIRLKRGIAIQESLRVYLAQSYEMAKMDEKRNLPSCIVIESAVPPLRRFRPKILTILYMNIFTGMIIAGLLIMVIEYNRGARRGKADFEDIRGSKFPVQ